MNLTIVSSIIGGLISILCGIGLYIQRAEIISLHNQLDQAEAVQSLCSASVEKLANDAKEKQVKSEAAINDAKRRSLLAQKNADYMLSLPSSVPGDDCMSAGARAEEWIDNRRFK
jgi:hypothetical protein